MAVLNSEVHVYRKPQIFNFKSNLVGFAVISKEVKKKLIVSTFYFNTNFIVLTKIKSTLCFAPVVL